MTGRINLAKNSTALTGGAVAVPQTFDIRELRLIAPDALDLPPGIQARLWTDKDPPVIVLWHRASDLHTEMPVTDMARAAEYAAALEGAAVRQACGEAPDPAGGYWVSNNIAVGDE